MKNIDPKAPNLQSPTSPITPKVQSNSKLTEAQAQSLLKVNNLSHPVKSSKGSKKLLVLIIIAFVVVVIIGLALNSGKPANSNGGQSLTNPVNNPVNNGGSINSQLQYCSNPVNADLSC